MQTPTDPHGQRLSEQDPGGVPRDRRSVVVLPGTAAVVWLGVVSLVIGAMQAMEHWTRTGPSVACGGGWCSWMNPPVPFGLGDALDGLAWAGVTFAVLMVAAAVVVSVLHRRATTSEGAAS